MAVAFMLLLLPALALASIEFQLTAIVDPSHPDKPEIKLNTSGNEVDVISDHERSTFKLSDSELKDAVRAYFGKRPDDAFLRSPTPWGDLYKTYGWSEVTRTLVPRKVAIIDRQSKPTTVMQKVFENKDSEPKNFDVSITQEVKNSVASSWSKDGHLDVKEEINYGIDVEVAGGGGSNSFSYSNPWGEDYVKSEAVTIGSSSPINIQLQPGESVVAMLQATIETIKLQIVYEAYLSGDTAVNYSTPYKGHHFWGLGIDSVMSSSDISNSVKSREVITYRFYSNSKVVIHEKGSGRSVMTRSQ